MTKAVMYREALRPLIDTLFNLVVFLSADRGGWGEEISFPFRWELRRELLGDRSVNDCTPHRDGLRQSVRHSFSRSGRIHYDYTEAKMRQFLEFVLRNIPRTLREDWEEMYVWTAQIK